MTPVRQMRVLYAEDNEDSRFMVTTMLAFADIDVTTARTIAEAWEIGLTERFDLYLLDSRFPDGSGFDLCRRFSEHTPHTPVVFYSGEARKSDIQNGLAAGAKDYLIKPYFEDLGETIIRAISQAGHPAYGRDSSFAETR